MHRFSALLQFGLLLSLAGLAVGCVGEISDPQRFGELPLCRDEIDVEALFRNKCGSVVCHGEGGGSGTGLDLVSPGVAERMVGVPSQDCEGQLLIDPNTPAQSHLTAKLVDPPAGCGSTMPLVGNLSAGEVACIAAWVEEAAETVPPVDAGPVDAGPIDAGPVDGGVP